MGGWGGGSRAPHLGSHLQFSVPEPRAAPWGHGCSAKSVFMSLWLLSVPNSGPLWERTALCPHTTPVRQAHTARALPPRAGITTFSPTRQGFAGGSPQPLACSPPLPGSPDPPSPPVPAPKSPWLAILPADVDKPGRAGGLHVLGIHVHLGARGPRRPTGRHWPAKRAFLDTGNQSWVASLPDSPSLCRSGMGPECFQGCRACSLS